MPPCHPAIPVPLAMASSRPAQLLLGDLALRPDGHDEVGLQQQVRIKVDVERLADSDLDAIIPQDIREERRALVGLMSLPTARDQQCSFRTIRHGAYCLPRISLLSRLPSHPSGGIIMQDPGRGDSCQIGNTPRDTMTSMLGRSRGKEARCPRDTLAQGQQSHRHPPAPCTDDTRRHRWPRSRRQLTCHSTCTSMRRPPATSSRRWPSAMSAVVPATRSRCGRTGPHSTAGGYCRA